MNRKTEKYSLALYARTFFKSVHFSGIFVHCVTLIIYLPKGNSIGNKKRGPWSRSPRVTFFHTNRIIMVSIIPHLQMECQYRKTSSTTGVLLRALKFPTRLTTFNVVKKNHHPIQKMAASPKEAGAKACICSLVYNGHFPPFGWERVLTSFAWADLIKKCS